MGQQRRSRPRLAIYRHRLLSRTDRFIAAQASQFVDSEVRLFGIERSDEMPLDLPLWALSDHARVAPLAVRRYQFSRHSRLLAQSLWAWRPLLILAHYAQDGWRIASTAKALNLPLVVTCHGSDVLHKDEFAAQLSWSARQLRRNWHRLVEAADLFLPVSRFVARALEERGVPPEKVMVHYLGTSIPPPPSPCSNGSRRQFLFVGRLEANKGCADLLDAYGEVKRRVTDARLSIVGDGPERQQLEAQAHRLGFTRSDVEFTGYLDQTGVARVMEESTVLCVPSVQASSGISEGLGLVALEGQARELPVIAYRTGGLPEAVEDGTGGVLVPTGDRVSLAGAMYDLITDPGRCRELGLRGRRFVEERFDGRKQTQLLERHLLARYDRKAPAARRR